MPDSPLFVVVLILLGFREEVPLAPDLAFYVCGVYMYVCLDVTHVVAMAYVVEVTNHICPYESHMPNRVEQWALPHT